MIQPSTSNSSANCYCLLSKIAIHIKTKEEVVKIFRPIAAAILLSLLTTSCWSLNRTEIKSLAQPLPAQSVLASSVVDNCISVVDAATRTLVGEVKYPQLALIQTFDVRPDAQLLLPINGDWQVTGNEIDAFNLTTGRITSSAQVGYAPQRIASQGGSYTIVTHNSPNPARNFPATILSHDGTQVSHEIELPGLATDVAVRENIAYIAIQDVIYNRQHALLVYDMREREIEMLYSLPYIPSSVEISRYHPNVIYVSALRLPPEGSTKCNAELSEIMRIQLDEEEMKVVGMVLMPNDIIEIDERHLLISEGCLQRSQSIRLLDVETGQVVKEQEIGLSPYNMVKVPDDSVAISLSESDQIAFVDTQTLEVTDRIDLMCQSPRALRFWERRE